jgi:hypothetical protein
VTVSVLLRLMDGARHALKLRNRASGAVATVRAVSFSIGSKAGKATLVAIAAAVALLALSLPGAHAAAGASATCPSFRVLHNDRIGPALLPAGNYTITVAPSSGLSCAAASTLFTRFLEDYDGVLPRPWKVVAQGSGKAKFTQGGQPGFSVSLGSSGGGGGRNPKLGALCPGNFRVLHNDSIGPLSFPKGSYNLYIPRGSVLNCPRASNLFRQFLNFPNGKLPSGWAVKSQIAVFYRSANPRRRAFRVDPST